MTHMTRGHKDHAEQEAPARLPDWSKYLDIAWIGSKNLGYIKTAQKK